MLSSSFSCSIHSRLDFAAATAVALSQGSLSADWFHQVLSCTAESGAFGRNGMTFPVRFALSGILKEAEPRGFFLLLFFFFPPLLFPFFLFCRLENSIWERMIWCALLSLQGGVGVVLKTVVVGFALQAWLHLQKWSFPEVAAGTGG